MRRTTVLALLLALIPALASCGSGGEESTAQGSGAGAPAARGAPSTRNPEAQGRGGGGDEAGAEGERGGAEAGSARSERGHASLATSPGSIDGARVTATGAVQTLPPSTEGRQGAMENSYSSIKSFGEEAEGREATDVTFALVQYLTAKAQGDWGTACARIYGVLRQNLETDGHSCPETYGALMKRASRSHDEQAAEIDVASVRRGEGNRAFVIYKTPNTLSADMPMYLDGGVWTVGALEAYALTPEELGRE